MSQPTNESKSTLRPEVQWNLRKRLPSLVFAVSIAGVGGFIGGYLSSYGPQYLNIHVTEAFHDAAPAVATANPVPVTPPKALELEPLVAPIEEIATASEEVLPQGAEARLVMQGKNRSYIVLNSAPEATWGTGAKRVRGKDFEFTVSQALASEHTSQEVEAWRGRVLTLYSASGYACSASVVDFELLQKSFEDGDDGSSVSREFLAGSFQLVARMEPIRGSCKSALWARDASLPPPALGRLGRTERSLQRLVLKTFRQSQDWQSIQKRFRNEGKRGNWDSVFDSRPSIRSMRGAAEELILVSADTASCGEFDGTLSMLYRVEPDGTLARLDNKDLFLGELKASADIDGDGDLDFIGTREQFETLLVRQDETLVIQSSSQALINYCGC